MKAPAAVLLLIAAVAAGVFWVTRADRPSRHGLSGPELRYVQDYGAWWSSAYAAVVAAIVATQAASDVHQLVRPYKALEACETSYKRSPRRAPDALQPVEDRSLRACDWAKRASALVGLDRYVRNADRQRALSGAISGLIGADRELVDRLTLSRGLPTADAPIKESRIDSRYSQVATSVVAFNIEVRCWSRADWAAIRREAAALGAETSRKFFGAAGAFEGVANLSPRACAALDGLAYDGRRVADGNGRALVSALVSLGRESEAGSGVGSAAEAQCDGLQDVRQLSTRLGAPPAEAGSLAQLGWQLYRTKKLDPARWSPACRDGGTFDKNASAVWP